MLEPGMERTRIPAGPLRVLIIDDDRERSLRTSALLEILGRYQIEIAADLEAGLAELSPGRFDACLIDGYAYHHVERTAAGTPVIMLNGEGTDRLCGLDLRIRVAVEDARLARAHGESQELLQATFDSMKAMIAVVRSCGSIVAVNRAWRVAAPSVVIGGLPEPGANYLSAVDDAAAAGDRDADYVAAEIRVVLSHGGASFTHEYRRDNDTGEHWFSLGATPFQHRGEAHVIIAHEDITTRRTPGLSARHYWECTLPDGQFQWSEDLVRLLGVTAPQLTRSRHWIAPFLHPAEADDVVTRIDAASRSEAPSGFLHQLRLADGSFRTVQHWLQFFPATAASPARLTGNLQEVAALRKFPETVDEAMFDPSGKLIHATPAASTTEEGCRERTHADGTTIPVLTSSALLEPGSEQVIGEPVRRRDPHATEQLYQTLFANANDLVFTVDNGGILTSFNRAGQRLTGYSGEEAIGANISDLLRIPDGQLFDVLKSCVDDDGTVTTRDCAVQTRDGSRFILEISAQPLMEGGRKTGWQAIARDITERRSLQHQLHHSQKMEAVGRLAGGIAHDFNNILTVVLGHTATLATRFAASDPIQAHLAAINDAGMRATALTRQLLMFSKHHHANASALSINETIAHLRQMLQQVIGRRYELSCTLNPDCESVDADQKQIEQIVLNLVINARDAMPDGGRIRIVTSPMILTPDLARLVGSRERGAHVVVSVADDGIGMDEATRQRVFEPFFTTRQVGKGTGLGLAAVYGIVKQLGGGLDVESAPGLGSIFTAFLPASRHDPVVTTTRPPEAAISRGTRLLLAEDEEQVRRYLVDLLSDSGFEVAAAPNGKAALALAQEASSPFQIVLSDIVMPLMKGPELIAELRKRWPDLPAVLMSGYTESFSKRAANELRVRLISKPFHPDELLSHLRRMLSSQRPRRILIVDDDEALRTLVRLWLEAAGYRVLEAGDGNEAVEQARLQKPDLLVTDLVMPVQMLRDEFPDLPVIAMSGAFHGDMLRAASRLGARAALRKPLTEALLLETVSSIFQTSQSVNMPTPD